MKTFIFAVVLVLLAVFTRLLPHAPNFTAVISVGLFSGAYLSRKKIWTKLGSLLIPVAAMVLSDELRKNRCVFL